jgi:putative peptidoglycan binding protein
MTILSKGSSGPEVESVQATLVRLGYDPGPVDGVFGQLTDDAVRAFQRAAGIEVDGEVGPETSTALAVASRHVAVAGDGADDPNALGTRWLEANVGPKEELGTNSGVFLNAEEDALGDGWLHEQGQPWCAEIGFKAAYAHAGLDLAAILPGVNLQYCPSIAEAIGSGSTTADGSWRLRTVAVDDVAYGDVMLFRWTAAGPIAHVGRVVERLDGATLTIEGNTPRGDAGDQSGIGAGDGIWHRRRSDAVVAICGRLEAV